MPDFSQELVRECVKSYLQANGLSYQYLADRLGVSLQTINNYMSKTTMSEKTVARIATALDYPQGMLLRGERYYGPDAYKALEERVIRLEKAVFGETPKE